MDVTGIIAAVLGAGGLASTVYFAVIALQQASSLGAARAQLATATANLQTTTTLAAQYHAELADERNRLDALDQELSHADKTADPATARDRVLARWRAERAAAGNGGPTADGGAVPAGSPAAAAGPG